MNGRRGDRASRVRLSPRRRCAVHAVLLGAWLSGACWLLLRYELRRRGEFGSTPNPLEPWSLSIHGAFAFAALVLGGWLLAAHLPPGWRSGCNRRSGIAMIAGIALLSLTGYLLYYLAGDAGRSLVAVLHWGIGLAMPAVLAAHLWRRTP